MIEWFLVSSVAFLFSISMVRIFKPAYYEKLFKGKMVFMLAVVIAVSLLITGVTEWMVRMYDGKISSTRIFLCTGYLGATVWWVVLQYRKH